jgi:serine/threonine protein kinase
MEPDGSKFHDVALGLVLPGPNQYRKSKLISSTAYSNVYQTRATVMNNGSIGYRAIAVKELRRDSNEYDLTKNLNHPYILSPLGKLVDIRNNTTIYFPWIFGKSLEFWILGQPKFYESDVRYIFEQMAEAVKYLHDHKIIHRDLKLENFMIESGMKITLIDFGLSSKHPDEGLITAERCIGTPLYMSPEMMVNRGHTYSTDIWSLGVCLYTLLYKRTPYSDATDWTELCIKMRLYPIPYTPLNITPECMNLVRRMLTKTIHDRISIDEIVNHPWFMVDKSSMDECFIPNKPSKKRYRST